MPGLIRRYLAAGVAPPDGTREATPRGVPRGGPLPPLPANMVPDPPGYAEVKDLSEWVGRRVGLYCRKQWKQPRTRRRHLLALGPPGRVRMATRSRKGCWRMSQN